MTPVQIGLAQLGFGTRRLVSPLGSEKSGPEHRSCPYLVGVAALVRALWICGPSGVGKSTVGWELYQQTRSSSGVRGAYVDLNQISFCRPEPDDDADNHQIKMLNLAAVGSNFRSSGALFLVMTGIVDDHETIAVPARAE